MTIPSHRVASRAARLAAIAILIVANAPGVLHAQTRGVVVDSSERPVAGAVLELWDRSRLEARTTSGEDGRFEFHARPTEPFALTVRRLGFSTQTIELSSPDTVLVVELETQPLVLDELSVAVTARRLCPNREDPRARALWEEMRSLYWQPSSDTVFVHGFMERRFGSGERADAFRADAGQTRPGWTTGALVRSPPELMVRSGYATPASGGVGERTAFWNYRALDHGTMQDFTGEFFGSVHTLSISAAGDHRIIVFCPRARPREVGWVEGTLHVAPDNRLQAARWRFVTPRPDEDAGGEASYYPPERALGSALLARETFFWRKRGSGRYYFEAHTFTGWRRWYRETAPDPAMSAPGAFPRRNEP